MTRLAVIYYSATGNVHALAEAIADGVRSADAEVRLRRVPELAPRMATLRPPPRTSATIAARRSSATSDAATWALEVSAVTK